MFNMRNLFMNKKEIPHGTKFDANKPRFELIPADVEYMVAQILAYGAEKYLDHNWTGLNVTRVLGSLKRHLNAIERGEDYDNGEDGSGYHNAAMVVVNAYFLTHLLLNYPDQDDRPFKMNKE